MSMTTSAIPFQVIDWEKIPNIEYPGKSGSAYWRTLHLSGLRMRMVEYSAGYLADHWCTKGHIVHCLEGNFTSELNNGAVFEMNKGMTYIVSDNMSSHRSFSRGGVTLLIIDGDFLSQQ
jgi:hypothetical protein